MAETESTVMESERTTASEPSPGAEGNGHAGRESARILLLLGGTQRQLSVPADVPVRMLVEALVKKYAPSEKPDSWTLASAEDGSQLDLGRTLASIGVGDLEELALIKQDARRRLLESQRENGDAGEAGESRDEEGNGRGVAERTAAILPRKPSIGSRFLAVWQAAVSPGPPSSSAAPAGHVDPASLAAEPRSGLVKRCAQAYRQSSYAHRLEQLIRAAALKRPIILAIASGKGGVGKTTVACLVAALLAFLRPERVVLADADPNFGILGALLAPGQGTPIDELTAEGGPLSGELTSTELERHLARGPDGVLVCPGPIDPDRCRALTTEHYLRLFEALCRHAGIVVVDCGTSFTSAPMQAVLEVADQLVLLSDDTIQAAAVAIYAARWLRAQGYELTLAMNQRKPRGYIDLRRLRDEIPAARGLASAPSDPAVVGQLAGSRLSWREDQGRLGIAIRELAALLAHDWERLTDGRPA